MEAFSELSRELADGHGRPSQRPSQNGSVMSQAGAVGPLLIGVGLLGGAALPVGE